MTGRASTVSIVAGLMLAGCGLSNPDQTKTAPARRVGARPAPTGVRTPVADVAEQSDAEVRVAVDYTLTQATWSPDTYTAQQAQLAKLSTGQALAELSPSSGDPPEAVAAQLAAAGSSSRAALIGTDGPNPADQVVVAYKTLATGAGRSVAIPDYSIAHVTLARHGHGWLVSTFEIQP